MKKHLVSNDGAVSPMSGAEARLLFTEEVLGRHRASYFLDEDVGFIFAQAPHWLEEAYASPIATTDTGVVARNIGNIDIVSRSLLRSTHKFDRGIDLAGGYGLFVRGMRDAGFDFYWTDKYADNLVARGFEGDPGAYDAAVAFEVLEHLENPVAFLREARHRFGFSTCFISATCFDERKPPDLDWWYWSFETGQHISFFSMRALHWMAAQLGMRLWPIEGDVFAFSSLEWRPLVDGEVVKSWKRLRGWIDGKLVEERSVFRKPLTFDDHLTLREKLRSARDDGHKGR